MNYFFVLIVIFNEVISYLPDGYDPVELNKSTISPLQFMPRQKLIAKNASFCSKRYSLEKSIVNQ